jgi:lipopolysaccharide export system protein LptA
MRQFRNPAFIQNYIARTVSVCLVFVCIRFNAHGQKTDTSDKIRINIINTLEGQYFKTDSGEFRKFIGDVILTQGTDTLYCDSVIQNSSTKNFEAFSNVRIIQQGGTEGRSDYLKYTSDKKLAYMRGNVTLTDSKNRLWSEDLTYDLGTKTGVYEHGGTLQSDSTIVRSIAGVYNVKSGDARFTGNVVVTDPKYKIWSRDLGYNTESKVETFFDSSIVTSDSGKSILSTSRGTYDSKNVVAHFTGPSWIWNDGQYIKADSMHYNKTSGYGFAIGHVISIDTTQHATIYCGRADFFRKQKVLWAIIKPVMQFANGKDTFYMRADTFYSAPMVKMLSKYPAFRMPRDTVPEVKDSLTTLSRPDSMTVHARDTVGVAKGGKLQLQKGNIKGSGIILDTTGTDKKVIADPTAYKKAIPDTTVMPDEENAIKSKTGRKSRKQKKVKDTASAPELVEQEHKPDTIWVLPAVKYRLSDFFKDSFTVRSDSRPKSKNAKANGFSSTDTTMADTTAPMFFTGYHHVLIFSDSMQAKCDSVVSTRSDSIIRMIYSPIAWAHSSQITGDTILLQLDSNSVKCMYVPDNSFVASQSGPDKAQLWDQIQGKTLTAFFKNNTVHKMIVNPEAESIYYSKDDKGAYIGVNEASSDLMRIYFGAEKISKIKFEKDVKQTMTPLEQADLPNTKLGRFKWLIDQRPKSKEELFR